MRILRFFSLFCLLAMPALASGLFDSSGRLLEKSKIKSDAPAWMVIPKDGNQALAGIGPLSVVPADKEKLRGCSGAVIDMRTEASDEFQPAYVLTAGHCVPAAGYRTVVQSLANEKGVFLANGFHDTPKEERLFFDMRQVIYATWNYQDIAIIELKASIAELRSKGIEPLKLEAAKIGEPVALIGFPVGAGDHVHVAMDEDKLALRYSACILENPMTNFEGAFRLAHRCSLAHGSSGGPMISANSGKIVAVAVSAAYESGRSETFRNGASTVNAIIGCFDKRGVWDASQPGCLVEQPCMISGIGPQCLDVDKDLCKKGAGWACQRRAHYLKQAENSDEIDELLYRSCDLGYGRGCLKLGERIKSGKSKHPSSWLNYLFARGCNSGDGGSCNAIIKRVPKAEAGPYLQKACSGGSVDDCMTLADSYEWPKARLREKLALYEFSCSNSYKDSCKKQNKLFSEMNLGKSRSAQLR